MQKYQSHDKTSLYTTLTVRKLQKNECFTDFRIATPPRTSVSLYVIYCRLRCGQRGSTCARHNTLDWIVELVLKVRVFYSMVSGLHVQLACGSGNLQLPPPSRLLCQALSLHMVITLLNYM